MAQCYRAEHEINQETYNDYIEKMKNLAPISAKKDSWIYDILNNNAEQDNVFFSDDKFIIIPPRTWHRKDISRLYLLAFVRDTSIRSLRDLTSQHIPLLKHIYNKSMEYIEETYNISRKKFRIYIHYPPTTWVLHIHFNLIQNTSVSSSVEYSHSLYDVLNNLNLDSEYYKRTMYVPSMP